MHYQRRRERDRDTQTERGREVLVGWGWMALGERMVLFAIRPFLFYTVLKKNKRTNTFLNKGIALEVEAHWGCEVAPLWVTIEWNHDTTALPTPLVLLLHVPKQNRPSMWALICEQEDMMGYTIPSYFKGYWPCVFLAFCSWTVINSGHNLQCNIEVLSLNVRHNWEKHNLWFSDWIKESAKIG